MKPARTRDADGTERTYLESLVEFGGRLVLELGCGEGRLTQVYAETAAYGLAIDPDATAIETARDLMADVTALEFRVAGATEIQLPRRRFDIALFSWSLWWLRPEDVGDVLRNVRRALKPDGLLIDVHPTRPESEVFCGGQLLGSRDDSTFFGGVDGAESGVDASIRSGLFNLVDEARYVVVDRFDSAEEIKERTAASAGSRLPADLEKRVIASSIPPFEIHHTAVIRKLSSTSP